MAVYSRRKIVNVNVRVTIYLCCYTANIFLDAEKSWSLCRQKQDGDILYYRIVPSIIVFKSLDVL